MSNLIFYNKPSGITTMVIGKPFLSVAQIQSKVKELAGIISRDYEGKEFLAVGILKGAFMFFSDLVRNISVPMHIDFLISSSYVKTQSDGKVRLHADIRSTVEGRHVLLIEDIVDTGLSLNYVRNMLLARNPASLKICTLLDKKSRRKVDVPIEYAGFEIPDHFVVGYGLDFEDKFRNLPYIAIYKNST
jgi:hypoxanthine phosphoribosyltransferase